MKFELFFFDGGTNFICEKLEELMVAVLEAENQRRYTLLVTDLENYTDNPNSVYNIVDWRKFMEDSKVCDGILFNGNLEYGNELYFRLLKGV